MYQWKKKRGKRGKESLDQSIEEKGATINDQVLDWNNLSEKDLENIHKQICSEIKKATDTFANDRQDDVKQMFLSMFFNPKIEYETLAKFGEIVVKRSEQIQTTTVKMCNNVAESDASLEKLFNSFVANNKEYGDEVKKLLYNGGEKQFPNDIDGAIDQIATQFYNYDVCVKCIQFLNASKETAESCKNGLAQANKNLEKLQGIIKDKRGELNEFHKKIIHVVGKGITYFQHISINYFKICMLCRTVAEKFDPQKKYVLTDEERVEIVKKSCAQFKNVEIVASKSLVLDFAKKVNACCIIRGLRNHNDFDSEMQLFQFNHTIDSNIETMLMFPSANYLFLSSSSIKELVMFNSDIDNYVPSVVKDEILKILKERL